jgi:hypothetical protein
MQQVNSYVEQPTTRPIQHDWYLENSIDEEVCMMNEFLLLEELRTEESEGMVDLFAFERLLRERDWRLCLKFEQ